MKKSIKSIRLETTLTYDTLKHHDAAIVLKSLITKYRNEHNTNIIDEATEKLDEMVYVPSQFKLWTGRFVRYIDATDPLCLKISQGGFVVNDNSYTVRIKTNTGGYSVGKRGRFFFMGLTNVDRTHLYYRDLVP
jgi:RNase P/RNase MRP subunit p29